jgi:pantoate--beta-alanine ligase
MKITHTIKETREQIKQWKKSGHNDKDYKIGFVPTMGFLHEGHQSLIKKSVEENDKTVVSIFVNPTQFAPTEDLSTYPRDFEADKKMCEETGADLIFSPTPEIMYPENSCTFVDMQEGKITKELCGKSRPTHFRGVCTVVNKLFNIITPDRSYFGQKDAQQLAVIKRMVKDLDMDVEIIGCPIIREPDGLAKSSRNAYLNPQERKAALVISRAVFAGERLIKSGERDAEKVITAMKDIIKSEPTAIIDYIEITDADSIQKIKKIEKTNTLQGNILAAIAVYIGKTRLIDNFIFEIEK